MKACAPIVESGRKGYTPPPRVAACRTIASPSPEPGAFGSIPPIWLAVRLGLRPLRHLADRKQNDRKCEEQVGQYAPRVCVREPTGR